MTSLTWTVFTVLLHVMQRTVMGIATEAFLSVFLSLRPFVKVKRVLCDKTKDTCAHILLSHERSFILAF